MKFTAGDVPAVGQLDRTAGRLDRANRTHIASDHPERGISPKEVDDVLSDPTIAGRWLVVIWIDQPEGRYPIHARAASQRIIRRLTNEG